MIWAPLSRRLSRNPHRAHPRANQKSALALSKPNRSCRSTLRALCAPRKSRCKRAATTTKAERHYHRNQQYSITALTDSSGNVTERYAYTAYGTPTITDAAGSVLDASADKNRYTYTGREWDETLVLYHYRARMYDSISGRFMGRDPIGFLGGRHLQQMCASAPIRYVDALGTKHCEVTRADAFRVTVPAGLLNNGKFGFQFESDFEFTDQFDDDCDHDCDCCRYRQFVLEFDVRFIIHVPGQKPLRLEGPECGEPESGVEDCLNARGSSVCLFGGAPVTCYGDGIDTPKDPAQTSWDEYTNGRCTYSMRDTPQIDVRRQIQAIKNQIPAAKMQVAITWRFRGAVEDMCNGGQTVWTQVHEEMFVSPKF